MIGRTGTTKYGFGRLLKAGLTATVVWQQGTSILIKMDNGDGYYGQAMDFILDEEKEKKEGV